MQEQFDNCTVFILQHRSTIGANDSEAKPKNDAKGTSGLVWSSELMTEKSLQLRCRLWIINEKMCFSFQVLTSYWSFEDTGRFKS